mmetsp:Transcript_42686/g.96148  ORF Transcript_42686/g.96148 Transcript_42686/m.96148 type:complete len:328 (-) Transcript_42686:63-1046(-)
MSGQQAGAKVLLMGRAGAGKTSMRSIIFANYMAKETNRLQQTNSVEHSNLRFMGNLLLNLWDCGGQDVFMVNYFESQKDHIFSNVEVLIYVLGSAGDPATNAKKAQENQAKDMSYFMSAVESIRHFSPSAKIFCLVHKLDLVHESQRDAVFREYETQLKSCAGGTGGSATVSIECFPTSIWDETLFKAWSSIVNCLVPNGDILDKQLRHFCQVCEADEVVLFEKATFLVIASSTRKDMRDVHRFEKVSNIVKQFKLSCGKSQTGFKTLTVRNSNFTAFIERFTNNTFVMIVISDPNIHAAATMINIEAAKAHFERVGQANGALGAYL